MTLSFGQGTLTLKKKGFENILSVLVKQNEKMHLYFDEFTYKTFRRNVYQKWLLTLVFYVLHHFCMAKTCHPTAAGESSWLKIREHWSFLSWDTKIARFQGLISVTLRWSLTPTTNKTVHLNMDMWYPICIMIKHPEMGITPVYSPSPVTLAKWLCVHPIGALCKHKHTYICHVSPQRFLRPHRFLFPSKPIKCPLGKCQFSIQKITVRSLLPGSCHLVNFKMYAKWRIIMKFTLQQQGNTQHHLC